MNKIKVHYSNTMAYYKIAYFLKDYVNANSLIVCIGTDRCIGDCLGPLVGTYLKNSNFPLPVYGTIDEPIHALNLNNNLKKIKNLHPTANIIGIDACLGETSSIGEIQARNYPIHPGKGVGKSLPDVGSISIIGIVDTNNCTELFTSRNIRFSLIMQMASVIKNSIIHAYYLYCEDIPHEK
ncbi:spore protease YyaC [Haloimpatiens sp. FM7330]|uniref:spore protease YyaC n=1 Tax=Haloimpatiens sp. FM7330 TaxID=3298610 RepID=UPI00363C7486